jgi:type VI secretion system secreted protein VgrG
MDQHGIESGTQGDYLIKSAHFDHQGPASMPATHPQYPKLDSTQRLRLQVPQAPNAPQMAWAGMPYKLFADGALLQQGVLDDTGYVAFDHQVITQAYRLEMSNGTQYEIPIPATYSNPEQGELANRGLLSSTFQHDPQVNQPLAHNELRKLYGTLLHGREEHEGDTP